MSAASVGSQLPSRIRPVLKEAYVGECGTNTTSTIKLGVLTLHARARPERGRSHQGAPYCSHWTPSSVQHAPCSTHTHASVDYSFSLDKRVPQQQCSGVAPFLWSDQGTRSRTPSAVQPPRQSTTFVFGQVVCQSGARTRRHRTDQHTGQVWLYVCCWALSKHSRVHREVRVEPLIICVHVSKLRYTKGSVRRTTQLQGGPCRGYSNARGPATSPGAKTP